VRAEAGLAEGTVVDFEIRADGVLIRPLLVVDDVAVDEEFVREMIASTTLGFAELRDDPGAWQEELDERRLLEGTLRDGLDGE
jgi:bifunctional DNA-binding transcriptional regulator/antitoxin component of YhaV-PrlF toxin-antitoxin module